MNLNGRSNCDELQLDQHGDFETFVTNCFRCAVLDAEYRMLLEVRYVIAERKPRRHVFTDYRTLNARSILMSSCQTTMH